MKHIFTIVFSVLVLLGCQQVDDGVSQLGDSEIVLPEEYQEFTFQLNDIEVVVSVPVGQVDAILNYCAGHVYSDIVGQFTERHEQDRIVYGRIKMVHKNPWYPVPTPSISTKGFEYAFEPDSALDSELVRVMRDLGRPDPFWTQQDLQDIFVFDASLVHEDPNIFQPVFPFGYHSFVPIDGLSEIKERFTCSLSFQHLPTGEDRNFSLYFGPLTLPQLKSGDSYLFQSDVYSVPDFFEGPNDKYEVTIQEATDTLLRVVYDRKVEG